MNGSRYMDQVLEGALEDFYTGLRGRKQKIYFQQDGAPAHKTRAAKTWFASHGIPLLFHPPNSPDLSPIEPVWGDLKRHLRARPHHPTTFAELCTAVRETWEQLPIGTINGHIEKMDARIATVLKQRGGHTGF